tara:strand:- start:66 stop:281 length:216 start_codon:yes stop_codon:yes gene_type:complete
MTYRNENSYLSLSELKDLTRESNVTKITEVLRTWGITPFVQPKTGFPVVFRDSLYKAQAGEPEFRMNLDAI